MGWWADEGMDASMDAWVVGRMDVWMKHEKMERSMDG